MPWWGWHACPLAPRNWCLGGFNTPFCLKKSLGNSWTSSFLSLKCWRTSGKWLKWTCTYCGLGMFTSFFLTCLTHCSPLFFAQKPQTDQAGTSRDHTISLENGCGTITVRLVNHPYLLEIGATYMHTQIEYIYMIYIYIIPYSKQKKKSKPENMMYHLHMSTPSWKHVCIFFYIATFCSAKLLEKAMERWYVQWQCECASTCVTFDIIWCGSFGSLCLIHVRGLVLNPCEVFLQLFRGGFAKPPKRPGVSQASLLGEVRAGISAIVARRGQEMAVWTVWVKQNRDLIIKNMGFNMI